jgi:hypothetical protein
MRSFASEDYESHEQEGDRSDTNSECQVRTRKVVLQFEAIH